MCEKTRIEASTFVFVKDEHESTFDAIHYNSQDADLVFLGLDLPKKDLESEFYLRISNLISNLPNALLVRNSGKFRGELLQSLDE